MKTKLNQSGSVVMQESDELEDLERLANDIFDESEDQFHGFYQDQTVQDIFGDSDDESELFERFNVTSKCWTILKATEILHFDVFHMC